MTTLKRTLLAAAFALAAPIAAQAMADPDPQYDLGKAYTAAKVCPDLVLSDSAKLLAEIQGLDPAALAKKQSGLLKAEIAEVGYLRWCYFALASYSAYGALHPGLLTFDGELYGSDEDDRIRLHRRFFEEQPTVREKEIIHEH